MVIFNIVIINENDYIDLYFDTINYLLPFYAETLSSILMLNFELKAGIGAGTPQQVPLCSNCYSAICNSKVKLALESPLGL